MPLGLPNTANYSDTQNCVSSRKDSMCCGFMRRSVWLLRKDFEQHLKWNHHQNNWIYKQYKLYEGLGCIFKGKAPGNDKWLKVRLKQLEQHLFTAQTNHPSATNFAVTSFQELMMGIFFHAKMSSVMKPLFIYAGMLTDITWESWGLWILMH